MNVSAWSIKNPIPAVMLEVEAGAKPAAAAQFMSACGAEPANFKAVLRLFHRFTQASSQEQVESRWTWIHRDRATAGQKATTL